jgi:predicted small secreted protein
MKSFHGILIALVLCESAGFGLMGCNTFRGAGKDIQKGGEVIEDAAVDAQGKRVSSNVSSAHTISASADTGGSISPAGDSRATEGANQTYMVTPAQGYHVADVLVDGQSVGAARRHTFSNVNENHTISALFTVNP